MLHHPGISLIFYTDFQSEPIRDRSIDYIYTKKTSGPLTIIYYFLSIPFNLFFLLDDLVIHSFFLIFFLLLTIYEVVHA